MADRTKEKYKDYLGIWTRIVTPNCTCLGILRDVDYEHFKQKPSLIVETVGTNPEDAIYRLEEKIPRLILNQSVLGIEPVSESFIEELIRTYGKNKKK